MGCNSSKQNNVVDFQNYTFDSTPEFSLNGQVLPCRVVDIYDGDTCVCVLYYLKKMFKFTIRLADIDTCELKSKNEPNNILAYTARSRLYQLITKCNVNIDKNVKRKELRELLNKNVYLVLISCGEFDKYGRLLGWLYDVNEQAPFDVNKSYNYTLINEHLAYLYKGDTKLTEEEQVNKLTNKI